MEERKFLHGAEGEYRERAQRKHALKFLFFRADTAGRGEETPILLPAGAGSIWPSRKGSPGPKKIPR